MANLIKRFLFLNVIFFSLQAQSFSATPQENAAIAFVKQKLGGAFSVSQVADSQFYLKKMYADPLKKRTVVRVAQTYRGIPIYGSDMSVHVNADNEVEYFNGNVQNLHLDTSPSISFQRAHQLAQAQFPRIPFESVSSSLEIFVYQGHPFLSWHVLLHYEKPRQAWDVFVDAQVGKVIRVVNRLQDAQDRREYAYQESPILQNGTDPRTLVLSEGQVTTNAFFQKPFNHLATVYGYFYKTFGRDSFDQNGKTITANVCVDLGYNNAFWDPDQESLTFGDGDGVVFGPLGNSLDIVGHEFGHALTSYTANLVYYDEPGALNESMSDFWGAMIKRKNWLCGEDSYTPSVPGDALRYLDTPAKGGQPEHYRNYVLHGNPHTNSGIPNKAAYLIASVIGRGDAEQLYYRALTIYFNSQTTFYEARLGLAQAAADLFGADSVQVQAVNRAFDQVGVTSPSNTADFLGTFVASANSTAHAYANNQRFTVTYTQVGAKKMKLRFSNFYTEHYYDSVYIQDKNGRVVAQYSGNLGGFESLPVEGDTIKAVFQSDDSVVQYGFDIDGYVYQDDTHITHVQALGSTQTIKLTWKAPTANPHFDYSRVEKSGVGVVYTGPSTTYLDTEVTANTTYMYTLAAVFKDGSSYSLPANTVTANLKVIPAVPILFQGVAGKGGITLSWADQTQDPQFGEFLVVRNTQPTLNGSLVYGGEVVYRGRDHRVTDVNVAEGHTYYYFLFIRNKSGYWSAPATLSVKSGVLEVADSKLEVQDFLTGPNPCSPMSSPVTIQYVLSKPADISLYLYSISGELVWSTTVLKNAEGGQSGFNKLIWEGKNMNGRVLANGMYILYLRAADGVAAVTKKWKLGVLSR